MKKFRKISKYILIGFLGYLSIGYLLHLAIFPEKIPEYSNYFKPGDEFYSKKEGIRQIIIKQEKG